MKKFALVENGKIKKVLICPNPLLVNLNEGEELIEVEAGQKVKPGDGQGKTKSVKTKIKKLFGF